VLNGLIEVNDVKVEGKYMAHLNNDGSELNIKALEDSRFIILAGEPINEKVSSYGPFVMNSQSEIMQALNDYQKGKMGFLVEDFE
jgi:redox-sensitive bicupin YhaK (pirin superfamily)